jgi:hypothetical protein
MYRAAFTICVGLVTVVLASLLAGAIWRGTPALVVRNPTPDPVQVALIAIPPATLDSYPRLTTLLPGETRRVDAGSHLRQGGIRVEISRGQQTLRCPLVSRASDSLPWEWRLDIPERMAGGPTATSPAASTTCAVARPGASDARMWAFLGPWEPARIVAVALPPDWPANQTILVVQQVSNQLQVARSRDGGQRWQVMGSLPVRLPNQTTAPEVQVWLPAAHDQPSLTLVQVRGVAQTGAVHFYRSVDGGASWGESFGFLRGAGLVDPPVLTAPPAAFAVGDGRLWRSVDQGASWESVGGPAGLEIRTVLAAPADGENYELFVGTIGFDPAGPDPGQGIWRSNDQGGTWQWASVGLEIDGVPARLVHAQASSPADDPDRTLFAVSSAPGDRRNCFTQFSPDPSAVGRRAAVFRSRDRGASWELVHDLGGACARSIELQVSPGFAMDGTVFLSQRTGGTSPAGAHCEVWRGRAWGTDWSKVRDSGSYGGCAGLQVRAGAAEPTVLVALGSTGWNWQLSEDAGTTWQGVQAPTAVAGYPPGQSTVLPPDWQADPSIYYGASTEVWRYGIPRQTAGADGCLGPVTGRFQRLWSSQPDLRLALGCPREPARPVTWRLRTLRESDTPATGYWPEGSDLREWFWLSPDGSGARISKENPSVWERGASQVTLHGAIQPFERGWILGVERSAGEPVTIVVLDDRWKEYPDAGPS